LRANEQFQALVERARQFIFRREFAYKHLFSRDSQDAKLVLKDLAKFCRAHDSTFHPDPHVRSQLDGRREVWLRIAHHLNLTSEELWGLYGRKDQ
jgi:hypothetical protein